MFELALVFTWIAGLLNILAVWDALEGPAYGYGDEEPEPSEGERKGATATGDGAADAAPAKPARSLAAEPVPKA
jgi:hypothetical protein